MKLIVCDRLPVACDNLRAARNHMWGLELDKGHDTKETLAAGSAEQGGSEVTETICTKVFNVNVDHRMLSGTQLSEDISCDFHGVGRTRITKVLIQPTADHIVELSPNRRALMVFLATRPIMTRLARR